MDNDVYESHLSTETTTKNNEKKLCYKQDEFKKNDLDSKLFFQNKIVDRGLKNSLVEVVSESKWLTTREAANYLRLSISSIKTMIYRGQIRVHKLGKRNRFLKEELDRLITSNNGGY